MYNQEIKERFLAQLPGTEDSKRARGRWLDRFEEAEQKAGKDIAEMTFAEAALAMASTKVFERASVDSMKSVLKMYIQWCRDNNVFGDIPGGILDVKIDTENVTQAVSQKLFRDENDLIYSLRKVRPFDEGNPEVVAVILAWLGLELEQILELQDSQVDLANKQIYNPDGSVLVRDFSDQIQSILQMYVRCEVATRMNGNTGYEVVKDRSFPNFIKSMKSRTSSKMGIRLELKAIRDMFRRINRDYVELGYESRLAYTNVFYSGCLSRLLQMELSGIDVLDSKNAAVVEAVFNGNKKYRSIKWSYESYKKAFNF